MAQTVAVGIDLGTTNSAVSYVAETGRTTMLTNELGQTLTPSVVQFDAEETVVGREALKTAMFDVHRVADAVKRDMGHRFYSRTIHGKQLAPEVIQACLLTHLKDILDKTLQASYRVVLTVPAFFDEQRRKITQDAGRMAGFSVLDIVNEPTAAALAYGEQLGYLTEQGTVCESMKLLVYDLGGGTFDVTLMQLDEGHVRTLATDGDVRLGGRDFDARLADYACQKFEDLHRLDPRRDPTRSAVLQQLAEEVKQSLSQRDRATLRLEYKQRVADIQVTRQQFEGLTADLLERTAFTTSQTLEAAGLTWQEIDRVLLVGGSTRMPMVPRLLERLTGRAADRVVNPDEAVARGAAIYASYLLARQGEPGHQLRFHVVDVNSHSLGVEGIDRATGRRRNTILIPRNTPLPTSVTYRFVTHRPDQENVVLRLLEGESEDPDECITIGRALLRELPEEIDEGHPIDVLLHYDANGLLSVRMQLHETDHRLELQLQRAGELSEKDIVAWQQRVTTQSGMKSFEDMLEDVLGMVDDKQG